MSEKRETAIITGAQGGLGMAISRALEAEGLNIYSPGRENLDVTSVDSVKNYFGMLSQIDLLVCNAGLAIDKPIVSMTESDWDEVMRVNLRGAFLCAREVSRSMMKRRCGHMVFISSFSALHPPVGQVNYAAAKSALLGMMKSMAQELGSRNVRVNAVLPGYLETKMTEGLSDEIKHAAIARHSLGRLNAPEVVGDFIAHLHQRMPHTSGQVFNLDSRVI